MKKIRKIKKIEELNCDLLINKFICYKSINNKYETMDIWFIYKTIPSEQICLAYDPVANMLREIHYKCIGLEVYDVYIF